MLARQRMLGAELGEDRHHHPADEVSPLRIAQGRLQQLESASGVSPIPGVEGRVQLGITHQAGAGRQSLGHEVARKVLEQVEGTVGVAASQQQPAEPAPSRGMSRVELERPAQGVLVLALGELVGRGGNEVVDEVARPRRGAGLP